MNEQNEIIRKKTIIFKDQKIAVHISKFNKWFHNGYIKKIEEDNLILDDEKEGEIIVFFAEIVNIEKREKKR